MKTLGILVILLTIFLFVAKITLGSFKEDNQYINGLFSILTKISEKAIGVMATIGIFMIMLPYLFFWAEPGYQYFLVYPTGNTGVILSQGVKFRGFAKVTPWQKYIDVKVVDKGDSHKEIEGIMPVSYTHLTLPTILLV